MKPCLCSAFFARWCALVAILGALVACGGGGGGEVGGQAGSGGNISTPGSATLQTGVFASSVAVDPSETVAVLTPDQRWWAVRRTGASSASIFSGTLTQDGQGAGSVASLQAYDNGHVRAGSAALSGVSADGFAARVSLVANLAAQPPLSDATINLSARKSTTSVYNAATAADLALLERDWTGMWIDGLRSSGAATVSIRSGAVSLPAAVLDCRLGTGSALSAMAGVNLFRAVLIFDSGQFNCGRSADAGQPARTLEGVAWIQVLPDASLRLEFVAVDAAGSGLVFRATATR